MPGDICIVGILVENRASRAPEVQQVITKYGSQIISRSGIPDPAKERGIITLTMETRAGEAQMLVHDLQRLPGVTANWMCLTSSLQ